MLHVLNLVAVLLLPVLVSSFPQSNRWKELYERRLQAGYPTPPNPLEGRGYVCCNQPPTPPGFHWRRFPKGRRPRRLHFMTMTKEKKDDRSGPLRRALQELTMLRHQQDDSHHLLPPSSSGADMPVPAPAFLPPGAVVSYGKGGLYARKREELLARLLGGRSPAAAMPVMPLLHDLPAAASSEEDGADLVGLRDAHKRGGFVVRRNDDDNDNDSDEIGAPGSPGGPNIGDCPSNCRTCFRESHGGGYRLRCAR